MSERATLIGSVVLAVLVIGGFIWLVHNTLHLPASMIIVRQANTVQYYENVDSYYYDDACVVIRLDDGARVRACNAIVTIEE